MKAFIVKDGEGEEDVLVIARNIPEALIKWRADLVASGLYDEGEAALESLEPESVTDMRMRVVGLREAGFFTNKDDRT